MTGQRAEALDAAFRRALGLDGQVDPSVVGARRRDAASVLTRAARRALDDHRAELAVLLCLAAHRAQQTEGEDLEAVLSQAFASVRCVRVAPAAHAGGALAACWSPDGEFIASGGADGRVLLWSGAELRPAGALIGHEDRVRRVDFNHVLPLLSSCGDDGAAIVWDVAEQREVWRVQGLDASALAARFSPDGDLIAVAGGAEWSGLRDARTGALKFGFGRHDGIVVYDAVFSPDGRRLATCGDDGRAVLWDVATGEALNVAEHGRPVRDVAFDPAGGLLASACYDGAVSVLDLASGERITAAAEGRRARGVYVVDAGRKLWALYDGGDEAFFGLPALDQREHDPSPHRAHVVAAVADSGGRVMAAADQDGVLSVRRWRSDEVGRVVLLRSTGAAMLSVSLSADGRSAAVGDADGALTVWSLDEREAARRSQLSGEDLWAAAAAWRKSSGRAPTERELELIVGEIEA